MSASSSLLASFISVKLTSHLSPISTLLRIFGVLFRDLGVVAAFLPVCSPPKDLDSVVNSVKLDHGIPSTLRLQYLGGL
ncbi:hypothetical protein RQP46_000069 [Phenoliferia psychrophenolica]